MEEVEIEPKAWILPNRTGFQPFISKNFKIAKYHAKSKALACEREMRPDEIPQPKKVNLFAHQKFIRDYMQSNTPYRGTLLYHGLGTGKTLTAIAAAEVFVSRHKKVFVLLPASLEPNFKNEILRSANVGLLKKKTWSCVRVTSSTINIIREHFELDRTWIEEHDEVWLPTPIPEGLTVIHADKKVSDLTNKQQKQIQETLEHILAHKYIFIRYNGLTKKSLAALGDRPFDDSFIVMDEAHNFISRVTNGGTIAKALYHKLMDAKSMKLILLSGTPMINHPFELCYMINLIRGPILTYRVNFAKGAQIPKMETLLNTLTDANLMNHLDTIQLRLDKGCIEFTLLPESFQRLNKKSATPIVIEAHEKHENIVKLITSVLKKEKITQTVHIDTSYALPISTKEFEEYYLDTSDPDHPKIKNTDLFMRRIQGTVSYFRTAGEELFPTEHPMIEEKVPLSDIAFAKYITVRDTERKMESNQKKKAAMGVMGSQGTVYRAFSRMCCNFVFPDNIKRQYPMEMRKALQKEISTTEEDKRIDDEEEETIKDKERKQIQLYEESLKRVLRELEDSKDILTINGLKNYSPKYAKVLERLEECPGKALIYSQFRTVEGLGVFALALKANGYVQVQLEKHGKAWRLIDEDKIMNPKYDGKRFMIFPENRDKASELLDIYNGRSSLTKGKIQLRGEVCKLLLISMSAAEGISLKNVRQTHILESFWNKTKINQVIGRAVRTCSHMELPPEERDVRVFLYMASFTPEQLKSNFTLRRQDASMTSDVHLWELALRKDAILQDFLTLLKKMSIDCVLFAKKNRPLANNYTCYSFPLPSHPNELAYTANVLQDKKDESTVRKVQVNKWAGKVVKVNGYKYIYVEKQRKLYDYNAWTEAGIAVYVPIAIPE